MSDTQPHDLHTFMEQVTREIASEYKRIYTRAAEDPGTAGDEGEENWATLFRDWLPPNYNVVTKGRLIGHDGTMSPQIDVLVLQPSYPRKLLEKKIWLAGGVIAAFECKNTLTAAHVTASVQRAEIFKNLFAPRTGTPATELRSPLMYGLLAHSHSWKGENSNPIENINRSYSAASAAIIHPRLLIDLVCVADLATWAPMINYYEAKWMPERAEELRIFFGGDWGITTAMCCASHKSENQSSTFTPISALIGFVTQRLAQSDTNIRDLADYYRLTNLWGSSAGIMRYWPAAVCSQEVHNGIRQGRLVNGKNWDEWPMCLI